MAQFQLSEADPLLVMALRGLRDTEPLFFQRTETQTKDRHQLDLFVITTHQMTGADKSACRHTHTGGHQQPLFHSTPTQVPLSVTEGGTPI